MNSKITQLKKKELLEKYNSLRDYKKSLEQEIEKEKSKLTDYDWKNYNAYVILKEWLKDNKERIEKEITTINRKNENYEKRLPITEKDLILLKKENGYSD